MRTVILTGGSSGIGRETAKCLAKAGCRVYEFSRHDAGLEGIIHKNVDVTDDSKVEQAVSEILEMEGKIDILVNCAGFGISGAIEFTDTEAAKRQLDVNFFGMVRCIKAVLTPMRKAGKGRIVNIGSVAGEIPIPFQAFYSASKAAISTYGTALANEMRPYGVSVTTILPGDIATGFTDAREKTITGDDEYSGRITRSVQVMEKDERTGMSPSVAGAYIAKIAMKKKVKPLYAIGLLYKFFTVLMRLLPCRLSNWMLYQLYAK